MSILRRFLAILLTLLISGGAALAQSNRTTLNGSVTISSGNTFQVVLPAQSRWSVTIQNNNTTTDNCWVYLGSGSATKANSILLTPALPYQRYYPYVPSDEIQATCATSGDSLYIDTQ